MVDKESTQEKRQDNIQYSQKYWQKTHKYRLCIPHTIKEAIEIDKENGDILWWDAILQEMKNVQPAFEAYKGNKEDLPVMCLSPEILA